MKYFEAHAGWWGVLTGLIFSILLICTSCAIGQARPDRVTGLAFGQAELTNCPPVTTTTAIPSSTSTTSPVVTPTTCVSIKGGALSSTFMGTVSIIAGALVAIAGGLAMAGVL
jgi:hypothetical protein